MKSVSSTTVEDFLAEDDGQSIVMLNLVRFKRDGGRQRYLEYLGAAAPVVARHGAEIIFAADGKTALAAEAGQAWDAVALVRYPTRQTFLDMISDPDYQAIDPLRISAVDEAVLQPVTEIPR